MLGWLVAASALALAACAGEDAARALRFVAPARALALRALRALGVRVLSAGRPDGARALRKIGAALVVAHAGEAAIALALARRLRLRARATAEWVLAVFFCGMPLLRRLWAFHCFHARPLVEADSRPKLKEC